MPTVRPLKWYRELAEKKSRLQFGVFLVEGEKAIRQIMGLHPEAISEIIAAFQLIALANGEGTLFS